MLLSVFVKLPWLSPSDSHFTMIVDMHFSNLANQSPDHQAFIKSLFKLSDASLNRSSICSWVGFCVRRLGLRISGIFNKVGQPSKEQQFEC